MEVHERIHGEPAFSCYICERKFQQEGNLKKHLDKRHSGDRDPSLELVQFEKAVKCALCPKEFKYFPGLINHVFRDHGDNSEELVSYLVKDSNSQWNYYFKYYFSPQEPVPYALL